MAFAITGRILADPEFRERVVTWDDGNLGGDPRAVALIRGEAIQKDGIMLGPPEGPHTMKNHIDSPLSTVCLAANVFAAGFRVTGDFEGRGGDPNLP